MSGGGSASQGSSATATGTASAASGSGTVAPSPWKLAQNYEGDSFFNGWDFFTQADPTHGNVQYVDQQTAQSTNLTSINSAGNAIMRVDTTPTISGGNRPSVRITTQFTYTEGLVIMDSVHMPTGCGTWPAFWSNEGPNWPAGGEIDIVEGVNEYTNNQATIHTNPGCTIPTSNSTELKISGNVVGGTNCAAAETGNAGCGITATGSNTYGPGFNTNGGGVYAMQWIDSGISVFFFPRSSIPSDITAGAPQPGNWGQPMASWPATDCNPSTFFSDHSAIFDTTLCGDWAGNVWTVTNTGGQSQSCAQITGAATCADYVANNGSAFSEAYWEVTSVKIYQQNS
ncbi:glycoside hydrolase family 16 protein [Gelatoporia subvermispora B]|uniref:Glycoside hydrolase family 16 protein n=1 Tax=Ceriporiopsis subvermispora (strain B) TaxID=914234 RepID=M2QWP2_CERS8|nr:glycoside hydrolase family 16 protein [Gelatoporia subvermispora B]